MRKDHPPLLKKLLSIRDTLVIAERTEDKAMERIAKWVQGDTYNTAEAYTYPGGQKKNWTRVVW